MKPSTNDDDDNNNKEVNAFPENDTAVSSCILPSNNGTQKSSSSSTFLTEEESPSTTSLLSERASNSSSSSTISSSSLQQTSNNSMQNNGVREEYVTKAKDFEILLEEVSKMILDYYDACGRPTETKVYNSYVMPEQIVRELGPMNTQAGTNEDCLNDLRLCFKHSLKTMHPFFLDKLYFGTDPIGQIAELVVAVLNSNTHVYHVSPVFSTMEVEVIQKFGRLFFGSNATSSSIDGTLNPGGSMSNTMALLLARNEHFPHVKTEGWNMNEDRPVAFTAVQSHYSVTTAAMIAGMGTNRMIQVPADRHTFQMDPVALETAIQNEIKKGNKPFFVNSVAGSTVMGAFDDLNAIGRICQRYGLWLHVDACWGGFLIFASKSTSLFDGMETYVDSVSFNPHKGLGVPQQCSMLLTNKREGALLRSNGMGAEYLFQQNEYDIGDKTLGCGRKGDALKLWLTMRKYGFPDGFQKIADNELQKANHMTELIRAACDFQMVNTPMGTNVCFWYTPDYFRLHTVEYTKLRKSQVHKLIFQRMKEKGHCLIQQQPLTEFDYPNFFRLALGADRTRLEDMEYLLHEIRRLGTTITPNNLNESN